LTFDGSFFDEDYFQYGVQTGKSLYENYRWIPELTIPMAMSIIDYMHIDRHASVLDYGSCYGMLVKAMKILYREAYGCDISQHVVVNADTEVKNCIRLISSYGVIPFAYNFDFGIAKDVCEHETLTELNITLQQLAKRCRMVLIVVPLGDGKKYIIPQMEMDTTHVIRESLDWWVETVSQYFVVESATYTVEGIKENWTTVYPQGNGFLKLLSKRFE